MNDPAPSRPNPRTDESASAPGHRGQNLGEASRVRPSALRSPWLRPNPLGPDRSGLGRSAPSQHGSGPTGPTTIRQQASALRRAACASSFQRFCKVYLPAYFRSPPSSMHLEMFELLQRAAKERGIRAAIAAPRGHAKTSIVSTAYALWCVCYALEPYIVLVSGTADQARDLLSHVKRELEGNSRLVEDFPDICETGVRPGPQRWRRDEIITRNDVKITALGEGGSIRGRKHRQHRPTLIILDDIENEANVRAAEQREHTAEWFNKAVSKLGSATTNIIVVGTILHYDSLLSRLVDPFKTPGWTSGKHRAVISWAERQDLWHTWELIYTGREEFEGRSGRGASSAFYARHEAEMLVGAKVLWPEHESYRALMEIRIREGTPAFNCEKQNEPSNPEDCLFREADFVFWDDLYTDETTLIAAIGVHGVMYGACDPSLGKSGGRSDDCAIISVLLDTSTGVFYVLDADLAKRKPDDILRTILRYHQIRQYQSFGFEVNQFQDVMADQLIGMSAANGSWVPVEKVTNTKDKRLRIESIQPLISSGKIRLSRRHIALLEQLRQYPHGAHDDGPDALEMAVTGSWTWKLGSLSEGQDARFIY